MATGFYTKKILEGIKEELNKPENREKINNMLAPIIDNAANTIKEKYGYLLYIPYIIIFLLIVIILLLIKKK